MSDVRADVLAIGSLAANVYWNEKTPVRHEYATATLVRSADVVLVVDPGWPAEVLRAALYYRAGLEPEAVTHVFLTHFDPAHFAGIGLFAGAAWSMYEEEIRWAEAEAPAGDAGREVLEQVEAAPEKFAPGADLFPRVHAHPEPVCHGRRRADARPLRARPSGRGAVGPGEGEGIVPGRAGDCRRYRAGPRQPVRVPRGRRTALKAMMSDEARMTNEGRNGNDECRSASQNSSLAHCPAEWRVASGVSSFAIVV